MAIDYATKTPQEVSRLEDFFVKNPSSTVESITKALGTLRTASELDSDNRLFIESDIRRSIAKATDFLKSTKKTSIGSDLLTQYEEILRQLETIVRSLQERK